MIVGVSSCAGLELDLVARENHERFLERGLLGRKFVEHDVVSGRLGSDLEDVLQSVDINPFVVLPQGGMALDALIVLRGVRKAMR